MFSRSFRLFFLILMITTAFLSGCNAAGNATQLDNTSWVLTEWSISSLFPADFVITANFADGQISGNSAVNSYGGSYTADPSGSFSTGEMMSTLMAGSDEAMRAESAYMTLLAQSQRYTLLGNTLTLFDANNNQLLIFTAAE
jgi:heat shock protein HslJ